MEGFLCTNGYKCLYLIKLCCTVWPNTDTTLDLAKYHVNSMSGLMLSCFVVNDVTEA